MKEENQQPNPYAPSVPGFLKMAGKASHWASRIVNLLMGLSFDDARQVLLELGVPDQYFRGVFDGWKSEPFDENGDHTFYEGWKGEFPQLDPRSGKPLMITPYSNSDDLEDHQKKAQRYQDLMTFLPKTPLQGRQAFANLAFLLTGVKYFSLLRSKLADSGRELTTGQRLYASLLGSQLNKFYLEQEIVYRTSWHLRSVYEILYVYENDAWQKKDMLWAEKNRFDGVHILDFHYGLAETRPKRLEKGITERIPTPEFGMASLYTKKQLTEDQMEALKGTTNGWEFQPKGLLYKGLTGPDFTSYSISVRDLNGSFNSPLPRGPGKNGKPGKPIGYLAMAKAEVSAGFERMRAHKAGEPVDLDGKTVKAQQRGPVGGFAARARGSRKATKADTAQHSSVTEEAVLASLAAGDDQTDTEVSEKVVSGVEKVVDRVRKGKVTIVRKSKKVSG